MTKIARTVKSLIAREVFKKCPEVKKELRGGEFFGKGYYANTVGQYGSKDMISNYVKNQGKEKEYSELKKDNNIQLNLFA